MFKNILFITNTFLERQVSALEMENLRQTCSNLQLNTTRKLCGKSFEMATKKVDLVDKLHLFMVSNL